MPNRMIRDGLLESEAVLSLPVEARWLYVTILLSADDLGLFEATEFKLARKADVRREHVGRLLTQLVDVDLIRLYEKDGRRYGFIPKFGQRLQIKRIKHEAPPDALLQDEPETLSKIKHLASKTTVDHGCPTVGQPCLTVVQPSEPEAEVEEKKETPPTPLRPVGQRRGDAEGFQVFWDAYPKKVAKEPARKFFNRLAPDEALLGRMLSILAAQKKSMQWLRDNGQFIPNPATWLNQKRWEDAAPDVSPWASNGVAL